MSQILSDSDIRKWDYKAHTKVKHTILRKYTDVWIKHLAKCKRICFFDCFAGRGEYSKGEFGSPIIVVDIAKKNYSLLNELVCTFIEKDPENCKNLAEVLKKEMTKDGQKYDKIKINGPICNEFAIVANEIIEKVDNLAPSFFFIDPFGFNGIPMDTIQKILSLKRTEVFITLMTRDINRFLSDNKKEKALTSLYGTERWKDLISLENSDEREHKLVELYQKQLKGKATFVSRPYRIGMDEVRQTAYYLIHATNAFRGFKMMVEIMARETSPSGEWAYRGPDQNQGSLSVFYDNIKSFKKFLIDKFKGKSITFDGIIEETLEETYCKEMVYRDAIKQLEQEGKVNIQRTESKKSGIRGKDIIIFL